MTASDVAFCVVVLVTLAFYYFNSVYSYWSCKNVVGPKPLLFFGNIKESALRRKHVAVLFKEFYDDFPNEKFVGFYRMTMPTLLIRDLDIVKQILTKDFETFPDRGVEFSKTGLGDNLFHCDVTTWKALRTHMTRLFTPEKLKYNVTLLENESDRLMKYIEGVTIDQQEQDVAELFQKYTIASIMACSFGISLDTMEDSTGVLEEIDRAIFTIPRVNEIEFLIPGFLKKTNMSFFNKLAVKYCYQVVEAARLQRNSNNDPTVLNNVMDILFSLQKKGEVKSPKKRENEEQVSIELTDHVIAGQVLIFYAAGYANNTNILSYAMYYLARNQKIQDKLIAEIDEVMLKFEGKVTYECINEMTYLDQVFNETLRMHPTTNSLQRSAARNYVIPGTDVKIEKGLPIIISPMAIHHDHKIYPNPSQFDPGRFAPDIVKSRHSCAYLPFGMGPRSCIAIRFAKVQFKVCAVKFLAKFRVEISGKTKDKYFINPQKTLLGPEGGVHLNILRRSS